MNPNVVLNLKYIFQITLGEVMQLLLTYDPKMQYATAMQMAHKILTYINVMVSGPGEKAFILIGRVSAITPMGWG